MKARREGGRRQGSQCPEETPGKEFRSPELGSLERTRSSCSYRDNSGRGTLHSPHVNTPNKKVARSLHP